MKVKRKISFENHLNHSEMIFGKNINQNRRTSNISLLILEVLYFLKLQVNFPPTDLYLTSENS